MLLDLFNLSGVARGMQSQQQQATVAIDFAQYGMWGKKVPQILRAVACVGERAFAAVTEVLDGRSRGCKMGVRPHTCWGRKLAAPVHNRRNHAAVFRRIERDAVRIRSAFRDEGEQEILCHSEMFDAIRNGPAIGLGLELKLRVGEAVDRPNDGVTALQQLLSSEFSLGIGHLTSTADLVAKARRADGKIPRINVPRAGSTSAPFIPALNGSAALAASLGSCMYITTRMRR